MQIEINHLYSLTKAKAWIVPENYRKTDYLPVIDNVMRANLHMEYIISVRSEEKTLFISLEDLIQDIDLNKENISELLKRKPSATVSY